MNTLLRRLHQNYAEIRIRKRCKEIQAALSEFLDKDITFTKSGNRGQDSIYHVKYTGRTIGVLRLLNPYKKSKFLDVGMPYHLSSPTMRLAREWDSYSIGSKSGITPKPIWKSEDAIVCEFLPYSTVYEYIISNPEYYWSLIIKSSIGLKQLHDLGLIHMDASISNTLLENISSKPIFIDFEFSPENNISIEQQKSYDYLRLIESSLKFIPEGMNIQYGDWLSFIKQETGLNFGNIDISPLTPALTRLVNDPYLWPAVKNLFYINRD
jgi:serine/threonine protein kinase